VAGRGSRSNFVESPFVGLATARLIASANTIHEDYKVTGLKKLPVHA
jgi:hypothetical protein